MRLDEILVLFGSPREAAELCGLSRTSGYHWYARGPKRIIPPTEVLVCWVDHFGFGDEVLGLLVRDCCLLRSYRRPRRRRVSSVSSVQDVVLKDLEKKERYLESLEVERESAIEDGVLFRLQTILERHMK